MNRIDTDISSEEKTVIQNAGLKELLDGRTERLSMHTLHLESRKELTTKPPRKYKTIKSIAEGGMKRIIQVKDKDTARDLAMALLVAGTEKEADIEARFIHEARITANLEHPNIVPIHDIGIEKDGSPYFTMKLIEGETLAHILTYIRQEKEGYPEKYDLRHLLRIFLKICDAIDFAHAKGIIHLDLKPENVKIGNYGEVLVLDWGLAKIISAPDETESELTPSTNKNISELSKNSSYEKTLDGEIKGTPGFMAPEQAAGDNSRRGPVTDIYALGTILYTILTFRKPITVKEIDQALDDTIAGKIIPIHERDPSREIPKPLAAITMKAMALAPEDRYQSVQDLIKDVDAFLGGYVTKAEDATILRHCELLIKRNKISSAFITLFLITSIMVFGMFLFYKTERSSTWGTGRDIMPASRMEFNDEWTAVSGNWKFKDDKFYAEEGNTNTFILLYNKIIYGNIAIEFDAEIPDSKDLETSGDLSAIIAGSIKHPEERGYFFQIGGIGNTSAVIQKRRGFMTTVGFPIKAGRKYRIRAEKEGAYLRLFCDGKQVLFSRDIFYLEGGCVGLYTFGKGKIFSNIKIYSKEVPALVPPTIEGDAFYRESRAASDEQERIKFLKLAKDAYTKVYTSHQNSELGAKALLKKAYISSELGGSENIISAIHDTLILKEIAPSLDLLLLEGKLYFDGDDYAKAFAAYERAIQKYPESAVIITSLLMGQLSPVRSAKICPELKQQFWRLCAQSDSGPVFRCSSRHLTSLDFLKGLNFKILDCSNNRITSLTPLKGMQLHQLDCADNLITSLEPLKDLPLETLECHNNKELKDISPLAGMHLKTLTLSGCTSLKDLSSLKQCKELERLTIPADLADTSFLRSLPSLKYINTKWDGWKKTKEEFFRQSQSNKDVK